MEVTSTGMLSVSGELMAVLFIGCRGEGEDERKRVGIQSAIATAACVWAGRVEIDVGDLEQARPIHHGLD